MSDDRLIQALRRIERSVDVDPAFSEALFSELQTIATMERGRGSRSMVLLVAALLMALVIGGVIAIGSGVLEVPWETNRDQSVTVPPDVGPSQAHEQDWPGPLRPEPGFGLAVARYSREGNEQPTVDLFFDDPVGDLGVPAADHVDVGVVHVQTPVSEPELAYVMVTLMLQAAYPDDLRERVHSRAAYGLVLETNGDGVPDYRLGIENVPGGRYRLWLTDLATGETRAGLFGDGLDGDRRGDGYPFGDGMHPGEGQDFGDDWRSRAWLLVGPDHIGLERQLFADGRVHFYAWASLIEDGRIVATDYAPDRGWLRVPP